MTRRYSYIFTVLLVIAALLLPAAVEAGKRHRHDRRDRLVVEDGTTDAWNGIVAETVDDFNAIMPRRGPKLIYVDVGPRVCAQDRLNICMGDAHGFGALAFWGEGKVLISDIYVPNRDGMENLVCHEFMHILAHMLDNYDSNPQSCIYGQLSDPGPFDIEQLKKFYNSKRRR